MRRALGEYLVTGIKTTLPFFTLAARAAGVPRRAVSHHLSRRGAAGAQRPAVRRADADVEEIAAIARRAAGGAVAIDLPVRRRRFGGERSGPGRADVAGARARRRAARGVGRRRNAYEVEVGGRVRQVVVTRTGDAFAVERRWTHPAGRRGAGRRAHAVADRGQCVPRSTAADAGRPAIASRRGAPGARRPASFTVHVGAAAGRGHRERPAPLGRGNEDGRGAGPGPQRVIAPMPGKIVRVLVAAGDAGQPRASRSSSSKR